MSASSASRGAPRPQSLLALCLGNICRSPLAEGIIRRECETRGLQGWVVDSAGTSGEHDGEPPDARSIAAAKRHGIDISNLESRRLTKEDWTRFDFILAMDSSNFRNAMRVKPANSTAQLVMYLPNGDVPESVARTLAAIEACLGQGFEDCYQLLNKHVGHTFERALAHASAAR